MADFVKSNHFGGLFSFSQAVINPPLDIYFRNWGAAKTDRATGIHKELKMTCLAIKQTKGSQALYIISADLGWWINPEDELNMRQRILDHYKISASNLLFCLSHTHSGPSICSSDKIKRGGAHILPYLEFIRSRAIELIGRCNESMQPGILEWEYGKCTLARNRDYPADDNKTKYLVGYNPAATADDTLLLGVIYGAGGRLGTIINYACHPTTLAQDNTLISPDFVGEMRTVMEGETKVPCLFIQGASGDLAPRVQYVADTAVADAHGRQLAYAALSAMEGKPKPGSDYHFTGSLSSGAPLAIWESILAKPDTGMKTRILEVVVPLKADEPLEQTESKWVEAKDPALKERLWRKLNKRRFVGEGTTTKLKLWIWKLGEGFIIAQPNEAYSEFQMKIRQAFPMYKIAVINIANGYIGYMPPAACYDKDLYAVNISPYGKGALELMTDMVIKAIEQL